MLSLGGERVLKFSELQLNDTPQTAYGFGHLNPAYDFGHPKVVGSIPTVVRHIFQACPVWIYTQSNITSIVRETVDIYIFYNIVDSLISII
jgi:hypothetical protein